MSDINSPIKRSKDRLRFSSGSCNNIRLHSALDEAKLYSNLVNRHLVSSLQENHVLLTAKTHYEKPLKRLASTGKLPSSNDFAKRLTLESSTQLRNPESEPLINAFHSKAQRIPQIGELFKSGVEEEFALRQAIKALRQSINEQQKQKHKIYMRNCKSMNQEENSRARIKQNTEQSRSNEIMLRELISECNSISDDICRLQTENDKCSSKIRQVTDQVKEYTNVTSELKRHLATETTALNELKSKQAIAYKGMMNDYMVINQLKEEKALMLNHVDQNIRKNA